jgi:hypothetical protein
MGIKLLLPSLAATWQTDLIKMAKTLKMNANVVGFDAADLLFMCAQTHLDEPTCVVTTASLIETIPANFNISLQDL